MKLFKRRGPRQPAPLSDSEATARYFALGELLEAAHKASDIDRLFELVDQGVRFLPAVVRDSKRQYGKFDIRSIRPIDYLCRFAPIRQDTARLLAAREIIVPYGELAPWVDSVDEATGRVQLVADILRTVREQPGILQSDLGRVLSVHGRTTASLARDLEADGQLKRVREGRSWKCFPGA